MLIIYALDFVCYKYYIKLRSLQKVALAMPVTLTFSVHISSQWDCPLDFGNIEVRQEIQLLSE